MLILYQNLQNVDLHRYDEAWEKDAEDVFMKIPQTSIVHTEDAQLPSTPRYVDTSSASLIPRLPNTVIIDLRQSEDYEALHIPGSENVPIVESKDWKPFSDASVLEKLWLKLEAAFDPTTKTGQMIQEDRQRPIVLLCYDGNSARVATSVLRAKGFEADSVRGGIDALNSWQQPLTPISKTMSKDSAVSLSVEEVVAEKKPYLKLV